MAATAPRATGPVLVTGATGYLGGRIAAALLREGALVRLLHRAGRRSALEGLLASAGGRAEAVEGDVTDAASLAPAVAGCHAVVHAAAHVSRGGPREEFTRVNVEGLRAVLAAAGRAGCERIVVTSSLFALGPSERAPQGLVDESALREGVPALDHYQHAKHRAAILAREAQRAGAPVILLFPGVLVGPGPATEGNFVTGLVREHLAGGLVPLPQGGRRRWSFVDVEDVAAAHAVALDRAPPGSSYVLGGGNRTLRELFDLVAELTGRPSPRLPLPFAAAWTLGLAEEALQALTGRAPHRLTRGVARVLAHDWALCSDKAAREIAWAPRPLRETLRRTIAWLETEGQVPAGTLLVTRVPA